MKAIIAKAIRQLLFVAGGAVGAKAVASESDIETISSAVMIVGSLAWSWWTEFQKRKAAAKAAATVGALCAFAGILGCVTPISDATITRVEQVAQSSAALGVAADLIATKNAHRAQIMLVRDQLDVAIATGTVTSAKLASLIVGKLPLDEKQAQWFNGALVLWGITSAWWVAPNADAASMAAAKGLSAGITEGLAAVPVVKSMKVTPAPPLPPKPTAANVKKV